jgi:hypothetical protein
MKQYTEKDIEETLQNNSIELFQSLKCNNEDIYLPIIKRICKKNQIDYFDLAYQSLDEGLVNARSIGNILLNLISYTKINIDNILKFYKLFHTKTDGTTSTHFKITKLLVSSNITLAKRLLEELLEYDDIFVVDHIPAILIELHNRNNESQYKTIIRYLESNNGIQLKCAISYIHKFDFTTEEIEEIFKLFKEKVKLSNNEIDKTLIYSSYDLIESGYDNFSEILLLYTMTDDIDTKFHLSQVLNFACENYINNEWFKEIFLSIININIDKQHIVLRNIESILKEYLKIDDYNYIKKFLFRWIEKGNLSSIFSKGILSTFSREFNKHKLFSKFITESLICENSKLHKILPSLIDKDIRLDVSIIEPFTFEDHLYVCRKILGYFQEFSTINMMLFSILSIKNLSNEVKDLVVAILINYIGKNYSYDTLKYYKEVDNKTLNSNEIEVKDYIIKELEARNKQLKLLPILKELTPPSQQNRIISRTQSITMSKAMKKSEEDSFWSQIATKISICYGNGTFSELDGKFTDVTYMQSYSSLITMPSATRTHPISYALEKYKFKQFKKVNR